MNFHDIVTIKGPAPSKAAAQKVAELVKRTENVRGWYEIGAPRERIEEVAKSLRDERLHLYLQHGYMPSGLRESLWVRYDHRRYEPAPHVERHGFGVDTVTRVVDAPKTTLSSLRALALTFGFPIMPFEYVRDDVRRPAWDMHHELGVASGLGFQTYIMGPVEIYSVEKHMEASKDLPVYAAGSALNSALLTVPALRALKREMKELRSDVHDVQRRLSRVEQDVQSIQVQVASMQMEIAEARRATALAQAAASDAKELATKTWEAFCLRDPIAVAIPPAFKITDEGWAVIGPCWGPDFEQIVAESLGVRAVAKQRALLAKRWPVSER